MRRFQTPATVVLGLVAGFAVVATPLVAAPPPTGRAVPFDTAAYRPLVALHPMPLSTPGGAVTISGIVFSFSPIERVVVADRAAVSRPAESRELMRLTRVPTGATEATYRTYFEVADHPLPADGAVDISIRAIDASGRVSDQHRVTVVRAKAAAK